MRSSKEASDDVVAVAVIWYLFFFFIGLSLKRLRDDIVSNVPPRVHPGVVFTHSSWRQ